MAKRKHYTVKLIPIREFFSPDFTSRKAAEEYKDGMMAAYKHQGFYSTSRLEHIPFEELEAKIVEA